MKLFSFATIVAVAGIAQVFAAPLVVFTNISPSVDPRLGHGSIKLVSIESPHDGRLHGFHAPCRHHHHKDHHHLGKGSFINRIHYSIMNLGHWEGRAVGFVLGCGVGVLLRMVIVLAIVMYRAVKGERGEELHNYSQITFIEEVVDDRNFYPPSYFDEKVPIVDETVHAPIISPPSYVSENYPIVVETVKAPSNSEDSK